MPRHKDGQGQDIRHQHQPSMIREHRRQPATTVLNGLPIFSTPLVSSSSSPTTCASNFPFPPMARMCVFRVYRSLRQREASRRSRSPFRTSSSPSSSSSRAQSPASPVTSRKSLVQSKPRPRARIPHPFPTRGRSHTICLRTSICSTFPRIWRGTQRLGRME